MNSAKPSGNFTLAQEKRCSKLETGKGNQKDLSQNTSMGLSGMLCCVRGAVITWIGPAATVETHNGATG